MHQPQTSNFFFYIPQIFIISNKINSSLLLPSRSFSDFHNCPSYCLFTLGFSQGSRGTFVVTHLSVWRQPFRVTRNCLRFPSSCPSPHGNPWLCFHGHVSSAPNLEQHSPKLVSVLETKLWSFKKISKYLNFWVVPPVPGSYVFEL